MLTTFEIYFNDLTKEAQERLLKELNINDPADGNYDIDGYIPLAILDFEVAEGGD